ncbi:hypothetical protein [Nocardia phage P3.1]|nr:hypothetical protein [Nocardia phage P3.1]
MGFQHDGDHETIEVWKDDLSTEPEPSELIPAMLTILQELVRAMYPEKEMSILIQTNPDPNLN